MSVKNIFKTTRANDLESVGEVREVSLTADESQVEFEHNGIEYTLVRDDSGVCTLSSAFVSGLGRFKCSKFPERIVLGEFSNHLHEEIGIQVDGGSLLLGIPSTNKRSYEVFLNIHNRDIPYEEYTMQRNTGKLFRMGQEDGENGILEGGTQNKEKLLQGLKETLEKKRIFLSEEDIESLVTDSDHDGLYEIDTNILGKNLFLYLRRELNMRQFVDATKTSALSERQIEGLRANIATELSKILKSPISKPNKDRLVDALRELIKTKQFKRYAELKQKYMRAHYAHIGNKGDAYESFKVNQEMMLPTIYDGGIHPPIKIGDCNVLASISRDIDKRAGATQTQYISINVTHNKGEPGSHRLLSSRLGKDTYLISDNCYQILVPTKLIGKFGFAEARKIMILLLRPNQINRSNKPILSFSLMKRYLDEYADMANYDPDHLRRGFAEAHMFRLQRRLEKTKVTFTNLEKLLRQAEKLYNE